MRPEPGLAAALVPRRRARGCPRPLRVLSPATLASVRQTLRDARRHCSAAAVPDEVRDSLEIVLAELMNNIVEHANAGRDRGIIDLELRVGNDAVRCVLRDDGGPMPGARLPEGRLPDTARPVARLPEGGFGWALIRGLTEELAYRREADGNCTSFSVPLAASPQVPEPAAVELRRN